MPGLYSDLNISNFYRYKEVRKNKNVIEFGWDASPPISSGSVVLSTSDEQPERNGATLVDDYKKYFEKLTGLSATTFLERWSDSEDNFKDFWIMSKPTSSKDMAEFIFKLAFLLGRGTDFRHQFEGRMMNFKIMDVLDEGSRVSSRDKDSKVS